MRILAAEGHLDVHARAPFHPRTLHAGARHHVDTQHPHVHVPSGVRLVRRGNGCLHGIVRTNLLEVRTRVIPPVKLSVDVAVGQVVLPQDDCRDISILGTGLHQLRQKSKVQTRHREHSLQRVWALLSLQHQPREEGVHVLLIHHSQANGLLALLCVHVPVCSLLWPQSAATILGSFHTLAQVFRGIGTPTRAATTTDHRGSIRSNDLLLDHGLARSRRPRLSLRPTQYTSEIDSGDLRRY